MTTETPQQDAMHSVAEPSTPATTAHGPFTPEQFEAARKTYEGLSALFAPKVSVNIGAQGHPEQSGDHKTLGDAADKALDLFSQGATKTLDLLGQGAAQIAATTEKAAPVIWGIMVKQQIANALANIIGPLVMLFGSWIFHLIIIAAYGNVAPGSDLNAWRAGLGLFAPIVVGIIGTIWLIISLTESLQQLVNPHYFAARDLIDMITGRRKNNYQ